MEKISKEEKRWKNKEEGGKIEEKTK